MRISEDQDIFRAKAAGVLTELQQRLSRSTYKMATLLKMDKANYLKARNGTQNLTMRQFVFLLQEARTKGIGDWLIDRLAGCESSSDTSEQLESLQLRQALLRRRSRITATRY